MENKRGMPPSPTHLFIFFSYLIMSLKCEVFVCLIQFSLFSSLFWISLLAPRAAGRFGFANFGWCRIFFGCSWSSKNSSVISSVFSISIYEIWIHALLDTTTWAWKLHAQDKYQMFRALHQNDNTVIPFWEFLTSTLLRDLPTMAPCMLNITCVLSQNICIQACCRWKLKETKMKFIDKKFKIEPEIRSYGAYWSSEDHLLLIQCYYRKKPKLN